MSLHVPYLLGFGTLMSTVINFVGHKIVLVLFQLLLLKVFWGVSLKLCWKKVLKHY